MVTHLRKKQNEPVSLTNLSSRPSSRETRKRNKRRRARKKERRGNFLTYVTSPPGIWIKMVVNELYPKLETILAPNAVTVEFDPKRQKNQKSTRLRNGLVSLGGLTGWSGTGRVNGENLPPPLTTCCTKTRSENKKKSGNSLQLFPSPPPCSVRCVGEQPRGEGEGKEKTHVDSRPHQEKQPDLDVLSSLLDLAQPERFPIQTRLVPLRALKQENSLRGGEEPTGGGGRVR